MQDVAWREQQRRLLTAQFGPREVESLAMNAVLPLQSEEGFTGTPLRWVQERELKAFLYAAMYRSPPIMAVQSPA